MPIDLSTLSFNAPIIKKNKGEHAFTTEYIFTIKEPNPLPVKEEQDKPKTSNTPPLVKIVVRTIDRTVIPPGDFLIYMDEYSEDFLQFSMSVFNTNGHIKPRLHQIESDRGTGVWGKEINKGTIAYLEEIRVDPRYQRQGLGRWAIENLLKCDVLSHCPFFFLWSTVLNDRSPFEGPDPHFLTKKQGVTSFWRSVGFRRVGGTWFFGYARDPAHPMRSLKAEDDAPESQTKYYTPLDAHDATFVTIG